MLCVGLLILLLLSSTRSRRRLKGLLELLGSTGGNGSGTLEGNSLASNIGYLLNKYTATWDHHGVILSQDLDRLRKDVSRLAKLFEQNEDDEEEDATAHDNNLNAYLPDDHEEEDAGGDTQ